MLHSILPVSSMRLDFGSMAGIGMQMLGREADTVGQAQQYAQQASAAKNSAKLAEATGTANMANYQRQASRQIGAVMAAVGASGTTFQGSPLEVLGDQVREQALQGRLIQYQGQLQGSIYRAQSKAYKQAQYGAMFSGMTGLAGIGMGGAFASAPSTPSMGGGMGGMGSLGASNYAAPTGSYNPTQSNYGMQNMPYIPPEKPGEYGLNTYGSDY